MPFRITSRRNPQVQDVRRLQDESRYRRRTGRFVVEGVRLAEEVLRAGLRPEKAFYVPTTLSARGQAVVAAWQERGVPLWEVTPEVMAAMSATETPQGLLLVLPWPQLSWPRRPSMLLLVDGLQDPGNLGTMLRTAWAAGVEGVVLLPGTVDVWSPKVVRAAMGAHLHLPLQRIVWEGLDDLLSGMEVYVTDVRAGVPYFQADWSRPFVLVIGNEAHGVREPVRNLATQMVHIPLARGVESLNAAVATGILLFEARRQRLFSAQG